MTRSEARAGGAMSVYEQQMAIAVRTREAATHAFDVALRLVNVLTAYRDFDVASLDAEDEEERIEQARDVCETMLGVSRRLAAIESYLWPDAPSI